ncbi:IS1 family transposase [Flavobacterium sp.]|uniref:IS1 family transposase n=1 Tax=Flavobacterium sp. TaxID=239 RepID=UPI00286CF2A2|nr:IS1 family transposase [Flavobacterium sp.]
MEKVYCPKCSGTSVKNGFQSKVQRYKCKLCQNKFQTTYKYQAYIHTTNASIITLLKESCGIRSIGRILNISKNTVLTRIISIGKKLKPKPLLQNGCSYEMDEIWTFIGNKTNVAWITYAIERKSRAIVGFVLGAKTKENIQPLVNQLILSAPKHIYTDRLNIYPALIPNTIHKRFQYCTNIIERNNLTLRTHLKRLGRKTICFSRSFSVLHSILKIYFWA